MLERLREFYRARFARCVASLQGEERAAAIEDPASAYRDAAPRADRRSSARRCCSMRDEGRVKPDVLRRIQRELDLDEARLVRLIGASPRSG